MKKKEKTMMGQKKKLINLISIGVAATVSIFYYTKYSNIKSQYDRVKSTMKYNGENFVKLKLSYVGCPCGLEYPQYLIDSVLYTDNDDYEFYLNKEIQVDFSSVNEEEFMPKDCSVSCYYWIMNGRFLANGYGMHQLKLESGDLFTDDECCKIER